MALPPAIAAGAKSDHERALPGLVRLLRSGSLDPAVRKVYRNNLIVTILPAIGFVILMGLTWHALTKPDVVQDISGLEQMGGISAGGGAIEEPSSGLQEPPSAGGLQEPPQTGGLQEPPVEPTGLAEPPNEASANLTPKEPPKSDEAKIVTKEEKAEAAERHAQNSFRLMTSEMSKMRKKSCESFTSGRSSWSCRNHRSKSSLRPVRRAVSIST